MKGYEQYIKDVQSGKITTSIYIKQAVERFCRMRDREDIYFDAEAVDECISFVYQMKHFLGDSAGKNFVLSPWQEFIVAHLIGLKWKDTRLRITRDSFIMVARKNGKSSIIAALALYMLIADGEASPQIACCASSRDQASIVFNMIKEYAKSIDPNSNALKYYRNYINFPANKGTVKVFSSDSAVLDGWNIFLGVLDEGEAQKDNSLYSVFKSSMIQRTQPLMIQICTAGFLLDGFPCFETYKLSIEILAGVKQDDSFACFLYCLDPDDEWDDENVWIKANPNMNVTVKKDFLKGEIIKAKNDASQLVPVKTKHLNIFCNAASVWIPTEKLVKCMRKIDWEQFRGHTAYIGIDLASVSDLSAISLLVPDGEKFYSKSWCFIPRDTFNTSPNHQLYEKFYQDGDLIISEGNICDYQLLVNKIFELSQMFQIQGIYYDPYNSSQFAIQCTEMGFNMQQVRQGLLSFSNPTKEYERLVLSEKMVIDKSPMYAWCMSNAVLIFDHNNNCKPNKTTPNNKIDPVISSVESLAGYLQNPTSFDFDIFVL